MNQVINEQMLEELASEKEVAREALYFLATAQWDSPQKVYLFLYAPVETRARQSEPVTRLIGATGIDWVNSQRLVQLSRISSPWTRITDRQLTWKP